MDSLYGGRPGVSFVIKANFKTIAEMKMAFSQGPNYTDCWYGEYCIIDTINKNHKDNGKIYRRGLNYSNAENGAEYIGQIVGPSSGTPYFDLNSINKVLDKANTEADGDLVQKVFPTAKKANGEYVLAKNDNTKVPELFDFGTVNDLVPGRDVDGSYNDTIKYTWCNIRTYDPAKAENDDSWFYVGFQIPYTVIDFDIHTLHPYDETHNYRDAAQVTREEEYKGENLLSHPFYERWDLGIPKGIKGDTLRNLRVITPTAKDEIYDWTAIKIDSTTGLTTIGEPGYAGQADDIAHNREILVFDYYIYDKTDIPQAIQIFVAPYNNITDINLTPDGILTVTYTHDDTKDLTYQKRIQWIDSIQLTNGNGKNGGHFTFTYNTKDGNNENNTQTFDVSWIKNLEILEDGSLEYTYAGKDPVLAKNAARVEEGVYRVNNFLTWYKNVDLNTTTGVFTITNNRNDNTTFQLDWIDNIFIDSETGEIAIHHVEDSKNTDPEKRDSDSNLIRPKADILENVQLKMVTEAQTSERGEVTLTYNTGDSIKIMKKENPSAVYQIKVINSMVLNTDINDDKRLFVKYNTENNLIPLGDPINFIQDMVVRESDFHLLVLFNDPTHRYTKNSSNDPINVTDTNGVKWVSNIVGSTGTNYGEDVYWRDYGTIKDQAGVLIGRNFIYEEVENNNVLTQEELNILLDTPETGFITYLNTMFPNGFTDGKYKGKIATYAENPEDSKYFFAYNYNKLENGWFYLGKIEDSNIKDSIVVNQTDWASSSDEIFLNLNKGGTLFIVDNTISIPDSDLPDYWSYDYNG